MLQGAALLLLCGLSVHGLNDNPDILRGRWTAHGREAFFQFAGAFAVGAWLFHARWPGRLHNAVVLLALGLTVGAVGLAAPAVVALFLLSSHSLGFWLLDMWGAGGRPPDSLERALAVILGAATYASVVGVLAHFEVNTPLLYGALLALPLLLRPGRAAETLDLISALWRTAPTAGAAAHAGLTMVSFCTLLHLVAALMPEVGFDALSYHLTVVADVALHKAWGFDVTRYVWAVMPMDGEWVYTVLYMLSGEAGARLGNLAFLLLDTWLVFLAARGCSSTGVAWLAASLFLSTPLVQLQVGSLHIENVWTAFFLGSVLACGLFDESGRPVHAFLASALAGAALAAKLMTAPVAASVALLLWWSSRSVPGRRLHPAHWLAAAALFVLYGLVPYAYAWLATGNPVFPFFNGLFRSKFYYTEQSFNNPLFNQPLSIKTLYDMTFHSHLFLEGSDGAFGFSLFVLLPLALLALRWDAPFLVKASWGVLLVSFPAIFHFQSYLRYIAPLVPLALVPVAWLFASLQEESPRLFRAASAAAILSAGLNAYSMPAAGWFHRDLRLADVLSPAARGQYVRQIAPERQINEYLNARYGASANVCYLVRPYQAELQSPSVSATWHNYSLGAKLMAARTAEEIDQLARANHFSHFVVYKPGLDPERHRAWAAFLARFTVNEFENGVVYLARYEPKGSLRDVVK